MKSTVLHWVIACLGYYIAGRCGLMLAIPPGFASAVWPAAGVALACAIIFRPVPVLLGVACGSFLLNLGVVSNNFTTIDAHMLVLAFCICMGAITQAGLALAFWHRLLPKHPTLDSPSQIYRFLLIIAPLSCLASATVGTTTLTLFGVIAADNVLFTALTWWVGDTIGVILFTPLILTSIRKTHNLRYRITIIGPTFIIFSGVLVLFYLSLEAQKNAIMQQIKRDAADLESKVHERFSLSEQKLLAYTALYSTAEHISRQQFNRITEVLIRENNALRAIGWTEIVPHSQRDSVEARVRAEGYPNFHFTELNANGQLTPAARRERYYPVLIIYPLPTNLAAFGLDLGANPERYAALDLAMRTGKTVNTAPIVLAQAEDHSRSFIMYLPIFDLKYRQQFHSESYAQEHLRGYISGVFDIQKVLGDLLKNAKAKHISLSIHDTTPPHEPALLIKSDTPALANFDGISSNINFGQRKLTLEFYANTHYKVATKDWTSWTILTVGFLLTAMLQALLLVLTGINERINREVTQKTDEYRQAKQDAEAASTAKTNFLANISHEFRTPLNAIIGFTNLCLKTTLNERQQGFLTRVQLASETLLALINHTLDYSKIESNTVELERKPLSLFHIYNKIEAIFSIQAKQKNITFAIEHDEQHPDYIWGDALFLEQILLNLCSNAIKFTDTGGITVRSSISRQTHDQIDLVITVSDTGIGIAHEKQASVFQAFQQADNSMSRRHGGTGLGLAITYKLITLMGGELKLESEEGQGCEFSVLLTCDKVSASHRPPSAKDAESKSHISPQMQLKAIEAQWDKPQNHQANTATFNTPLTPATSIPPVNDECLEGKTLLLVEDIEMNQILAQQILEDYGAQVVLANNGLEAVNILNTQRVDAVLMDIQMPIMDGYQATRIIREAPENATLPIIAMTANVASQDIQACKEAGMNEHIGKPINEDLLLSTLMEQLYK